MAKVFISSTVEDLKDYRTAVALSVQRAGFDVIMQEYFTPQGRYNLKGSFETLYLAPNPEAAIKESTRGFSHKIPPKVLMTIEVTLSRAIDLGDRSVLNELMIDTVDLAVAWRKIQNIDSAEAVTQKLGRVIFSCSRFEAIRYPSALVKGRYNLAVFPDRLLKDSKIKIFDPDKIIEHTLQGNLPQ